MSTTRKREVPVCGRQAVRSLGDIRPDVVKRLFFTAEQAPAFGELCACLATNKRLYRIAEPAELERLSGSVHHQGVVAMIDDPGPEELSEAVVESWAASGARIILLDRIGDDHNLGSIARTAAFFGYDALVICRQPGAAGLSTSAYRVARGGLEFIKSYSAASAKDAIELCKGKVMTAGADHRGATDIRSFAWRYTNEQGSRSAVMLILGNEEKGLSMDARAACDVLVRIRGAGKVESLNVSQTASIFLYELAAADRLSSEVPAEPRRDRQDSRAPIRTTEPGRPYQRGGSTAARGAAADRTPRSTKPAPGLRSRRPDPRRT
ncbi:MAG: RNA methyltransferase [Spirochaetes bacterium]|nr:RNA methyltransferase [Spirochaetota bacterium]